MGIDQAIEAEAQAQALCMLTQDFRRAYEAFVAKQRPVFRRQLRGAAMADTRFISTGRSSKPRHRALARASSTPGRARTWCRARRRRRRRMPRAGARRWATPAGCATRWPARRSAAPTRPSTPARALPDPRDAGPPFRSGRFCFCDAGPGLGRDQRWPARRRKRRATCRAWRAARPSPPLRCPSPRPARTWRRWAARRASMASTRCSTARRPGSPTAASPTSTSSLRAPGKHPAHAASRPSSSMRPARPASRSPSASTSSRRTRWRACASRAAASLPASASARAGEGFKIAMRTLDVFRTSVAAAALGFARRAMQEGLARATSRHMFGQVLADFQLTQAKLAQMATTIDSAALLTYRAAWLRDQGSNVTREAAMAKMVATEGAQQVIDAALQLGRPGRGQRDAGGTPVPRDPRTAHLRRRHRGPAIDHRARSAARSGRQRPGSHEHAQRPPRHLRPRPPAAAQQQPEFLFELPELQFPAQLNCATELLDRAVREGRGDRVCIRAPGLSWTYRDLQDRADRIAQVLVHDMGLVPGNRVLLRAPNNPMLAACWFAVMKAGAIAVATMPLLRAKELKAIVDIGQVSHALCDAALAEELQHTALACPGLRQIRLFNHDAPDSLERCDGSPSAGLCQRRHRGRRLLHLRLHLGHHGRAQVHDALPPRRDGHLRLLAAACAARERPTTCSSAARRWPSPSGWEGSCCFRCPWGLAPCCWKRPARRSCWTPSRRSARRCSSPRPPRTARWPPARAMELRAQRRCASACRPARRCRPRRARCGARPPASS